MSKKTLAVELSNIKTFYEPNIILEQYPTDSEIAASALWEAAMKGWIKDKKIADLGAGTGILGLGALLMGAKSVDFVEKDKRAIKILSANIEKLKKEYALGTSNIIESDILQISEKYDLVIMNPPFGTKNKGEDTKFLLKAFALSNKVVTFHKTETAEYIENLANSNRFSILHKKNTSFPLKKSMPQHKKKTERIKVTFWLLEKS